MGFKENIKALRVSHNYSQQDVAKYVGTTKTAVSLWESGDRFPRMEAAYKLAALYGVSVPELLKDEEEYENLSYGLKRAHTVRKPLVGSIACGEPILAAENIEEYVEVPVDIKCDFLLRCKGDSMTGARIYDGDLVYIRQQPTVEDGEIAAVLIGEEATLKRVRRMGDQVLLLADNPAYLPMVFDGTGEEMRIIGKAVGCLFQL